MRKEKVLGEFGELTYHTYPGGSKTLFAFHGFGQNAQALLPVIEQLRAEYTVYSFNHFFHGSNWNYKDNPLSKLLWKDILSQVLQRHHVHSFDLLAFSLGGKIALTSFELYPTQVNKMLLLAPDGIGTNAWYDLATYPNIFRRYFKSMIVQPKRFYSILNGLSRFGLVDKGLMRFAANQMSTASRRHRVYFSWIVYKEFKSSRDTLIKLLNSHSVSIDFWLGEYDRVIPKKAIHAFAGRLTNKGLHVVDCGHNDLIDKVAMALSN